MSHIIAKNRQKFSIRLADRYGEKILSDFDDLFIRQFWNLADLARKYVFTRERARQIFLNLYGHGYRQIEIRKTAERNQEHNLCSLYFPPRFKSLLPELEKRQMRMERISEQRFKINSHIVRFYTSSAVDYGGYGNKHFRVALWNDDFDFGIVKGGELFYVIPKAEFRFEQALHRLVLYIRATPYAGSNKRKCGIKPRDIEKYREAWHLLK